MIMESAVRRAHVVAVVAVAAAQRTHHIQKSVPAAVRTVPVSEPYVRTSHIK